MNEIPGDHSIGAVVTWSLFQPKVSQEDALEKEWPSIFSLAQSGSIFASRRLDVDEVGKAVNKEIIADLVFKIRQARSPRQRQSDRVVSQPAMVRRGDINVWDVVRLNTRPRTDAPKFIETLLRDPQIEAVVEIELDPSARICGLLGDFWKERNARGFLPFEEADWKALMLSMPDRIRNRIELSLNDRAR